MSCYQSFKDTILKANHNKVFIGGVGKYAVINRSKIQF